MEQTQLNAACVTAAGQLIVPAWVIIVIVLILIR